MVATWYQMQNPYYNYYPMAQPMYNSYPMPSPGLNQPFYEQPMPINGMIYYNPDGSQAYPQEYYQYPPVFMNPYQQQHYDY
ncbi:protein of unknown function [Taphrina deformans PYCC 5710]|uniref:Uncharacterized protein n=1 Tax=Taphrina deformans (strain PYCC 5710 / ATCC 11124 / CBS 356.35 / IMI 108563 / JCM 9778 / NBRC 8474) TaxID=1097556 RepID=R4XBL9_TAPDE|nr:protein of unknown function [Taphrina deformans PYCC 5710]|eukprot:CCG83260.1 protein of unknown function [Taphrina deformans PYCC 5710]